MNKSLIACLIGFSSGVLFSSLTYAQATTDNTQTLPDAKPGECYAKVVTPAKFATRSEEVVVQEATERVETVPAKFEVAEQSVIVREASRRITVVPAKYTEELEKIEVKPAENNWTLSGSNGAPASPGALEGIVRSGIELASVEPGSCFVEYFTEAEYKTETRRFLKTAGSEKITVIPAKYETTEERVVVKEAYSRTVDVPATYRTESESVLIEPARSVWKVGRGPIEKIDDTTGEIMCLVELPARYETLTKTVLEKAASTKTIEVPAVFETVKTSRLVTPASETREVIEPEFDTLTTTIKVADAGFFWLKKGESVNAGAKASGREVCLTTKPAEFRTVKKQVLQAPATTNIVEVPAEFTTVKVDRLVTPPSETRVSIPARTKTVTKQVQIEPSRLEWRQILCETNVTPQIIRDIQNALKREGYDPGPIDGVIGQTTLDAMEQYQIKENLDRGGLTYQSLQSLKVER